MNEFLLMIHTSKGDEMVINFVNNLPYALYPDVIKLEYDHGRRYDYKVTVSVKEFNFRHKQLLKQSNLIIVDSSGARYNKDV